MTLRRWRKKEWGWTWGGYVKNTSLTAYNFAIGMTEAIPPNSVTYALIKSDLSEEEITAPIVQSAMQSDLSDSKTNLGVTPSTLSEVTNIATPFTISGLAVTQTLVSS